MRKWGGFVVAACSVLLMAVQAVGEVPIPVNSPVSGHEPGLQNEEQIWICPRDTSIIVTNHRDFRLGYRQIGIGRGIFNGLIWSDNLIPPSLQVFTRQSDPVMTVNPAGDIIISHLDYDPDNQYTGGSHIAFLVSDDCGASWSGPTTVLPVPGNFFEDKQFITCDRTGGPYDGNVYVSWTRFPNPDQIMFARSTDNTQTFDTPVVVGPATTTTCFGGPIDAGQFSQPLVGKDGAVYVFWQGATIDSSAGCDYCTSIRVNKSLDGGSTWLGDRFVRCVDGYNYADGDIDVYSQPTTDADITDGPHAGNLYLQWRDVNPDPPNDHEIYFMRSLDTGHTWSPVQRVNDDPLSEDVDQFHNWLVCNDEGVLVSIWYDQRMDPAHWMFDVFAGYSYDGGETWTSNHRISLVSSTPDLLARQTVAANPTGTLAKPGSPMEPLMPLAGLLAEYIGVSCIGDIIAASWTDTRDGDQDVYAARWHLPLTDPRLIFPLAGETVDETPGLYWATAWKEAEVFYQLQIDDDAQFGSPELDLTVYDNLFDAPLTGFPDGVYYWRIRASKPDGITPADGTAYSVPGSFTLDATPCDCGLPGDVNCDESSTPLDVIFLVKYVYQSQDALCAKPDCPYHTGDMNCDGDATPLDVIYLVNKVYKSLDAVCDGCNP